MFDRRPFLFFADVAVTMLFESMLECNTKEKADNGLRIFGGN